MSAPDGQSGESYYMVRDHAKVTVTVTSQTGCAPISNSVKVNTQPAVQDSTDITKFTFEMPAEDATMSVECATEWNALRSALADASRMTVNARDCDFNGDKRITASTGDEKLEVKEHENGDTVTLNLDGITIDRNNLGEGVINIAPNAKLTITGNGTIKGSDVGVSVETGATFNMKGGTITGNKAQNGGGVYVNKEAIFNMKGGKITGNTAVNFGGGVYVSEGATFNMEDGEITGNKAQNGGGVSVDKGATFEMKGGRITGNTAQDDFFSYGGGVYVFYGTFNMQDGEIIGNTAKYGGVFVDYGGTFTMTGGTITGNKADYGSGGGILVNSGTTFTLSGGTISGNTAKNGGGVYVVSGATFNLSGSPTITGNTGGNVYLAGGKITVIDKLTNETPIGVAMPNAPGVFTSGLSDKGAKESFTSDDAIYAVDLKGGEAFLGRSVTIKANDQEVDLHGSIATGTGQVSVTGGSLADGDSITAITLKDSGTANATDKGTITPSGATITNGTVDVTGNYIITYETGVLKVNKGNPTVTAPTKVDNLTYKGTAQALVNAGTTTGGTLKYAVTRDKNKPTDGYNEAVPTETNAGTYHVWYKVDGNDNYNGVDAAGPIEVTIGEAPLTVTAKDKAITYGDAPADSGVDYSGFVNNETAAVLDGTLAYAYNYKQYDGVGDNYTITPGGLTSDNYKISFVAGTLKVNQRQVSLDWSNKTLTFTGNAQAPTATATNTVNGDAIGVTVTGQQTNAGDNYTAAATALTGDKAGNYKLPDDKQTLFTISPAALTVSASGYSGAYDKAAHGITVDVGASGATVYYGTGELTADNYQTAGSTVNPTYTDAGDYTVYYYVATGNNASDQVRGSQVVHIGKESATAVAPEAVSGLTYSGRAQTLVTAGGATGGTMQYGLSKDGPFAEALPVGKDAGTYAVYYKAAGDANHGDSAVGGPVSVTIAPKTVDLTWADTSFTYDGQGHAPTATATGLVPGDACAVTVTGEQANVGSHTATAAGLSNGNYALPTARTQDFAIGRRAVTVTAKAQTVERGDGVKTGADQATLSGAAEGHTLSTVTLTASSTAQLTTNGTITPSAARIADASGNDVTDNYNITYEDGTLTVVPKPGEIDTKVKTGEDVPQMQVEGFAAVAESVASEEEKARVKAGETLLVYLDIENIDDTVSEDDKALVTAAATGQDTDAKIGMYLDMSLFKQIGNDSPTQVSELSTPLTVKIAIPEELQKAGRMFFIVRVHEGVSEIIAQGSGEAIECATNLFSTYAVIYVDAKEQTPTPTPAQTAVPAPEPAPDPVNSDTMLLAEARATGRRALTFSWNAIGNAEGYDVFLAKCAKGSRYKMAASVDAPACKISGLKPATSYRAYVRAWKSVNGSKAYIGKSPVVYVITGGYNRKWCNARTVKVKKTAIALAKGKSSAIRASVKGVKKGRKVLRRVRRLRYYSSNTNVVKVSRRGKITAVGEGTCKVYVVANNGVKACIEVTVTDGPT